MLQHNNYTLNTKRFSYVDWNGCVGHEIQFMLEADATADWQQSTTSKVFLLGKKTKYMVK